MKFVVAFIFLIAFCCCVSKSINKEMIRNQEKDVEVDSVLIHRTIDNSCKYDMMDLTLNNAIKKYGEPLTTYDFIIDQCLNNFRIELYNIYSKDDYMQRTIKMKEITWATDSVNLFTIWYEVLNDSVTIAKDSCSYKVGTDF